MVGNAAHSRCTSYAANAPSVLQSFETIVATPIMADHLSVLLLDEHAKIVHTSPEEQEANCNSSNADRQDDPDALLVGGQHSAHRWPVAFLCAISAVWLVGTHNI